MAYNLLDLVDTRGHNWVSQVSELKQKYDIEMDDSDITIKNKVNCHCNQILMSKIGNITLIFKFQSTNDLATNYGIIF